MGGGGNVVHARMEEKMRCLQRCSCLRCLRGHCKQQHETPRTTLHAGPCCGSMALTVPMLEVLECILHTAARVTSMTAGYKSTY